MWDVFSKSGTDRQKPALERRNVQRIVFVPLFMAALSIGCVVFFHESEVYPFWEKLSIAMAFYAVISLAFSCFAYQLIKRRSKKSEMWLFQMLYMIVNTSFLTYISYACWEGTGTLTVYTMTVILSACVLIYHKGEYVMSVGIECLLPLVLYTEKALTPQMIMGIVAVHLLGAIIAFEIGSLQASSITLLANKYLSNSKVIVKKDLSGFDRFIFILNGIKE